MCSNRWQSIGTLTDMLLTCAIALLPVLPGLVTDVLAQGTGTPPGDALRVTWQPRQYTVVPAIEGYVQNESVFRVSSVRLRVEGFDASGQAVGETSTWAFGTISPGGRGHFVVPTVPGAATYRITVTSFDRVSREQPPNTQSP